jgi:hypothetical protein
VRLNILDAISAPQFPASLPGGNSHMNAYPGPGIWEFQVLRDLRVQRAQTGVWHGGDAPQSIQVNLGNASGSVRFEIATEK